MFVHQDIDLMSTTWLEDTEKVLNSLENLGGDCSVTLLNPFLMFI
jgi:hypothetical protein